MFECVTVAFYISAEVEFGFLDAFLISSSFRVTFVLSGVVEFLLPVCPEVWVVLEFLVVR